MKSLSDNNGYLEKMRNAFADKAWFMKTIPTDVKTVIDFGSADNSFIQYMKESRPDLRYIGIDNNSYFLNLSKQQGQECYESLTEMKEHTTYNKNTTLLVLNSVLHEVYSYGYAGNFWDEILALSPKHIAIRDMYAGNCDSFGSVEFRAMESIIEKSFSMNEHYKDFIEKWGRVRDGYTAIHFLLKYFYDENWIREVSENYIPFTYRDLYKKIREVGYNVAYSEFYLLPFLKNKWLKDFKCEGTSFSESEKANAVMRGFITRILTHMKISLVKEENFD